MSENKQCPECKAYIGHTPNCSLMSEEYAKSELIRYWKVWNEFESHRRKMHEHYNAVAQKKINRIKAERDLWKGKFFTVKNENNQLRKKI